MGQKHDHSKIVINRSTVPRPKNGRPRITYLSTTQPVLRCFCVLYRRTAANQNLHRLRSNDVVVELGFAATVDFLPKVVHGEPVS